jgi:hypothetical protein
LPITCKILSNILLSRLTPYAEKIIGDIRVDLNVKDQLLIIYVAFVKYFRKKREYNEAVHRPLIYFKKAYDSVRREVMCNILIEFGITMKLARPIKYSYVRMKPIAESG